MYGSSLQSPFHALNFYFYKIAVLASLLFSLSRNTLAVIKWLQISKHTILI